MKDETIHHRNEDRRSGGRCFHCKQIFSSSPRNKVALVDPRCFVRFKDGIEHPTPAKIVEQERKEAVRKPTALNMEKDDPKGKCKAMGDGCEWEDIAITAVCVQCEKSMHVMCVDKFDDGEALDGEALHKCKNCSSVNAL